MTNFDNLSYLFREPEYPVIVEIGDELFAAKSVKPLYEKLSRLDIAEDKAYEAIDATGETWIFMLTQGVAILSPINFKKEPSKLELIRWFNSRKNKPSDEVEYSEKSLSSKRRDRIIAEIADRLLDAEKRMRRFKTRTNIGK